MNLHSPLAQISGSDLRDAVIQAVPSLDIPWQKLAGGRVNLLWRANDLVIKQYQPCSASPLFPNDPQAEANALTYLQPFGAAPKLVAQGQAWLVYQYCQGAAWHRGPDQAAKALAQLHKIPAPQQMFRNAPNGSAQLLAQAKMMAALCASPLPPPPQDPGLAPGPTCLIHGDAVPGNFIQHQGRITLIDWQCPAIGDPAEDIATFLSPAMQWLYRGAPLTAQEIKDFRRALPAQTLARYDQLAAIYHWRMAAHCLWKSERNAPDYQHALQLELAALQGLAQQNTR
ncbi:phosphotransferase family protein [Pseudorhodobacter wandonensis]|uniref:phosphotransferase family protein n=1 Tax=Pseudorhodobacter wandonensis TaxID=1120568 RepID=UPI00067AF97D|nr:aminoglycoside phosphotransferase family protein [Pseudorhodobacter wandonensis]